MRASRGIRATAWALVAAGVAAPALRKRLKLPAPVVLGAGFTAPAALCVAVPRTKARDVTVCLLNMWAYIAAYEMPHDNAKRLEERTRIDYPVRADRALGLGVPPTLRLQRAFSTPGSINRVERVLVWCHWLWFFFPHTSVAYVLVRRPERFAASAARMYAVFNLGAVFYWSVPTAPPWYAAAHGRLGDAETVQVRRMMIEYGEQFWGDLWEPLYDVLGGNPLAAMPSLHFATSLMGAQLLSEVDPVAGALGWSYVVTLGVALVYLGEHYLVDLLAGAALTQSIRGAAPRVAPLARRFGRLLEGWRALGEKG